MRIQVLLLSIFLACLPAAALAGANHDHGSGHDHGHDQGHSHDAQAVTEKQAQSEALKQIARLVKKGKLKDSWKNAQLGKVEKKEFSGKQEWVVSFSNKKINDASKQTLYVFLSASGKYIAANFSGK